MKCNNWNCIKALTFCKARPPKTLLTRHCHSTGVQMEGLVALVQSILRLQFHLVIRLTLQSVQLLTKYFLFLFYKT